MNDANDPGNGGAAGDKPAGPDRPDIPPPEVIPPAPTWVMIIGATAGLMTLAGFFGFALLSGTNPDFACNSFTLLAPIFAFGAALAVSFIGGSAALNGQLGDSARRNAVAYSAGGGIAVFFIAFILFQMYQPQGCGEREATLNLTRIKQDAVVAAMSDVWQQRRDDTSVGLFDVKYLITKANGLGVVEVTPPDKSESCSFHVEFVGDLDSETDTRKNFSVQRSKGNGLEVTLVYTWRPKNPLKAASPSCFSIDAVPMAGYIAISPNEAGAVFGLVPSAAAETEEGQDVAGAAPVIGAFGAFVIAPAFAQDPVPEFSALRDQLLSPDPDVRVSARQYLAASFSRFAAEIVAEIMNPQAPPGDYLGNLLSALITGIDEATEGGLAPGIERDLSQELPFIGGREARIVELTAHEDAAVRKQARRLIQRFPMDVFAEIYAPVIAAAADQCAIDEDPIASQAIIYSSIFFTYNRIIQTAVSGLTVADADAAEATAQRTLAASQCLEQDLRVDSALLYYGLSTIYGESGFPDRAREMAGRFLETVNDNGGAAAYYFQAHVVKMQKVDG